MAHKRISDSPIHPIMDMSTPSKNKMIEILDRIDESIEVGKPVYIHCWGGRGRTGTVVGCYLARHGYASGWKILEIIRDLRENTKDIVQPSPETSSQSFMIKTWVGGE